MENKDKVDVDNKLNLLIVDDDEDMLVLFYLVMKNKGYDVDVSRNAETFWEDLFFSTPDIIILDISMDGIDGRVICQKLKEHEYTANIPVILLSAHVDLEKIASKIGADGFVQKPFSSEKIILEMQKVLKRA